MNNLQTYSKAYQPKLPLDVVLHIDDVFEENSYEYLVLKGIEESGVIQYVSYKNRDSYGYDSMMMLKCVLLGAALYGSPSVREYEEYCRNDIRFMCITDGERPSFMAFARFIKDDLTEDIEKIMYKLNEWIEIQDKEIDTNVVTIDGTKLEANANKMSFVWMKATKKFEEKAWVNIGGLIKAINEYYQKENIAIHFDVQERPDTLSLLNIGTAIEEDIKKRNIKFVYGKGKRKTEIQRYYDELKGFAKRIMKYEIYHDIAGERNSFSKTDPDATFMHMKYDYYNHTGVFKPGYNVQIGASDGYIRHVYISSDANDMNTYIPFMQGFKDAYGYYPKITPADAGYGSYDNYYFCTLNGIKLYMKYPGINKESEKVTDKNKYKKWAFRKDEEGNYICPEGHKFYTVSGRMETRGKYPKYIEKQITGKCDKCPVKDRCTKSEKGRIISTTRQLEKFQKEVRDNISTEEGKRLMTLRSIQSEGIFGNIKNNWEYDKIRRRGTSGVKTEILIVCIGANFRKLSTRLREQEKLKQQMPA